MFVRNPPAFAPNSLRRACGLVEDRAALLRVVAPSALLRAVYLHPQMTATEPGRPAGPARWSALGAQFVLADFGDSPADAQTPAAPSATRMRVYKGLPGDPIQGHRAPPHPRAPDDQVVRIGWNLGWVKRDVKNNDRIHRIHRWGTAKFRPRGVSPRSDPHKGIRSGHQSARVKVLMDPEGMDILR